MNCRDALAELLYLYDLKHRLHALHEMGHGTDWDDYRRRKPIAWANARAALAEDAAPSTILLQDAADCLRWYHEHGTGDDQTGFQQKRAARLSRELRAAIAARNP